MPDFRKTIKTEKDGSTTRTINVKGDSRLTVEQTTNGDTAITVAPKEAKHPLPDMTTIVTLGTIVAVIVWGSLEVVKLGFKGWKAKNNGTTPWFWAAAIRLLALVLGGLFGTYMFSSIGKGAPGWPWGTGIGIGAGALCTIIVGVVKTKIKGKASD